MCVFKNSTLVGKLINHPSIRTRCPKTRHLHADCRSPLVVGDVQVPVDGEEGLLQEADPLFLLLLRLLKDGLHLLHVARRVGRHFLQGLLVVLSALRSQEQFYDELCYEATDRALMFFSCFVFTETELECISHLKLSAVPMWCSVNTVRGIIITHVHAKEVFRTGIRGRGSCLQLTTPQLNKYQRTQQTGDTSLECHMLDPLTGKQVCK